MEKNSSDRGFPWALVVGILTFVAIFLWLSSAGQARRDDAAPKSAEAPPSPAAEEIATTQAAASKYPWPLVDDIETHLPMYKRWIERVGMEDTAANAAAYFLTLRSRRDHAIDWSRAHQPQIVFVANVHTEIVAEQNSFETVILSEESQSNGLTFIASRADKIDVFTFEQDGGDEPMTVESLGLMVQAFVRESQGTELSLADAEKRVTDTPDIPGPLFARYPKMPIYAGEEWPIVAESSLRHLQADPNNPFFTSRTEVTDLQSFIAHFDDLRSEIIVIRTLEFLEKRDGDYGMIHQGCAHGDDLPAIADLYQFKLEVHNTVNVPGFMSTAGPPGP